MKVTDSQVEKIMRELDIKYLAKVENIMNLLDIKSYNELVGLLIDLKKISTIEEAYLYLKSKHYL